MTRPLLHAFALLAISLHSASAQTSQPPVPKAVAPTEYRSAELGITFPARLAGLPLTTVTDYEKQGAGLGVGVTYQSSSLKADIYIYTAGYNTISSGADSVPLKKEFQAALTDITSMEQMGFYRDVKVSDVKDIVSIGSTPFLHAQLTLEMENIPRISHIYIATLKNRFLKIRCTYVAADAARDQQTLKLLLDDLAKLLDSPR